MAATPPVVSTQKNIALDPEGNTPIHFGPIKDLGGTVINFSTGWTFRYALKYSGAEGPGMLHSLHLSDADFTGNADGTIDAIEPDSSGGIAANAVTATGQYTLQGSTDTFTTLVTLAYGNYLFTTLVK